MGYADIRSSKQHEADAAKIAELEAQLKRERESKPAQMAQPPPSQPQAVPNQTVIVKNEGCLAGAGKGCLSVILGLIVLAIVGHIIAQFSH